MDAVGYLTYAVPWLGELGDLFWAPVSGLVFFLVFGGWKGVLGGVFNFAEEVLPGTDFIPSFTLAWLLRKMMQPRQISTAGNRVRPWSDGL